MSRQQRDRLELIGAAVFLAGCIYIWPPLALLAFGVLAVLYANFKKDEPEKKEVKSDAPAD